MSTEAIIPDFPLLAYTEALTGMTVRGGHTLTRATAANVTALARPARRIGPTQGLTTAGTLHLGYERSHTSIKQLWLAWYYRPDLDPFSSPPTITITTTIRDDVGNTITSSSDLIPPGFDGTGVTGGGSTYDYDTRVNVGGFGFIDLDAAAAILTGATWTFQFDWTRTAPHATSVTLDRIEGWECPRSQVDDADTYGALTGPVNPGNPALAGSTTTLGYERIAQTVAGAILAGRTLLSVAWPADTAVAPVTTSATLTAFTRMLEGGTTPWPWRVRPRVVYAPSSATGEPHRVRYLYRVTGGGTAVIRCTATSVGAGSVTTCDASGLTSATFAWSAWVDTTIPTDGTDRIAKLTFTGKTTAGTLYVAAIEVEEHHT